MWFVKKGNNMCIGIDERIRKFLPYFIVILNLTRLQYRERKVFPRIIASVYILFHYSIQKRIKTMNITKFYFILHRHLPHNVKNCASMQFFSNTTIMHIAY